MKQKYYLVLNDQEHRLIIESMNQLRNKLLILLLPGREMAVDVLIVSTPVYVKNPAKDGDVMLFGKSLDRF